MNGMVTQAKHRHDGVTWKSMLAYLGSRCMIRSDRSRYSPQHPLAPERLGRQVCAHHFSTGSIDPLSRTDAPDPAALREASCHILAR